MKAVPLHDNSWLRDRCNHAEASSCMMPYDSKNWRTIYEEGSYWIEADADTNAETLLIQLVAAEKQYPLLCERRYFTEETRYIHDAIRRKGRQSRTIIDSENDVAMLLFDAGIEVIEDTPCHFIVVMDNADFKQFIEKEMKV